MPRLHGIPFAIGRTPTSNSTPTRPFLFKTCLDCLLPILKCGDVSSDDKKNKNNGSACLKRGAIGAIRLAATTPKLRCRVSGIAVLEQNESGLREGDWNFDFFFFLFYTRSRRIIPTGIDFGGAGWRTSGMRAILSVGVLSLFVVGKTFLQTDFGLGWDSGHGVLHTFWRMLFLLWAARNKALPLKLLSLNKSHSNGQRNNNCVYVHICNVCTYVLY